MTLETNSSFEKLFFDKEAKDWMFMFADSISIVVSGFWRLLENSKIILVSLDQGLQLGPLLRRYANGDFQGILNLSTQKMIAQSDKPMASPRISIRE